ncbi:DUF134 domain-containing protein [Thermodesulfobacteriota bacterium]
MARRTKCRLIEATPEVTYFKPQGVPLRDLTEVYLPLEGFEALRLADYEGLKQEDAALRMNVSRQTFSRILIEARRTVVEAVVNGLALFIQGGNYVLEGRGSETIAARAKAGIEKTAAIKIKRDAASFNNAPEVSVTKEFDMGLIAVSSEGPTLDDRVDPRFGRAAGFIIVDPVNLDFKYLDNDGSQARGMGAGIQAAELVAKSGVKSVLTGYVGPKAFKALTAAGIKVGQDLHDLTVREAVERFKSGRVKVADRPNR